MTKKMTNVFICGVGGQGILLSSKILSALALDQGYDVKKSEVHGMAQRGGSVVSPVRIGEKIHSPLIEEGGADFILAFEKMEALRWLHFLKPDGVAIVNTMELLPSGQETYPEKLEDRIKEKAGKTVLLDANAMAIEAGNVRSVNVLLLGVLSNHLDFDMENWRDTLQKNVKPKTVEINLKALEMGRSFGS